MICVMGFSNNMNGWIKLRVNDFRGVLALIFVLLLMGLTHNVVLGLLGLLLSWVIVLLFHDFMVVKTFVSNALKPIFLKETTFRLLRLSLPLGFVTLLITLTSSIPRYVLERYTDEATLGYFGALAYLIVIGNTVVMALGQASISRLAQFYSVHTDKYLKLLGKLLFLVIVLGFGGISFCLVWGKQILNLLYGIGYGNYADVLVLVAIGGVIGYVGSVFGFGITASRKFQKFTIPYLLVVIVIMISSYLLIPDYGIYGAAWTQIIGSIAMVLAPLSILVWLLKTKEGVSRYKLE